MDRLDALKKVEDYLQYLYSRNSKKLIAVYDSPILRFVHSGLSKIGKGLDFELKISPNQYVEGEKGEEYRFVVDGRFDYENGYCWGFGWNSRKFYDGERRARMIGNGIILVDKEDGKLYQSPTFRGYDYMMEDFSKFKEGLEHKVSWEYMERVKIDDRWVLPPDLKNATGIL